MIDVKVRLKQLKKWHKEKYPTENARYCKIYESISECSNLEQDNLEIILLNGLDSAKRLDSFKSIIPMFITIASLIITLGSTYIIKIADAIKENISTAVLQSLLQDTMQLLLTRVLGIGVLGLILYLIIDVICSKSMDQTNYLIRVLQNVKEDRRKTRKKKDNDKEK
ncbi:MAG: hypothetical protein ACRDBO_14575 [Lachnospiraceae bacterium]